MKETYESWARKVRARSIVAVVCSVLSCFVLAIPAFADCPGEPTTHENGVIEGLVAGGGANINSSIGMDEEGRFLIAWPSAWIGGGPGAPNRLYAHRFAADGECLCNEEEDQCPGRLSVWEGCVYHNLPSVALSRDGRVSVAWLGNKSCVSHNILSIMNLSFDFDLSPFVLTPYSPPTPGSISDHHPSAGVSDYLINDWKYYSFSWAAVGSQDGALVYWDPSASPALQLITECGSNGNWCFQDKWQSCVAMRSGDGVFAVAWAAPEYPTFEHSTFDIKLQIYGPYGAVLSDEITVNQPFGEEETSEESPAISFDEAGNLVAVWVGPSRDGCEPAQYHVYARRLQWSVEEGLQPQSEQFIVDSDPEWPPIGLESGNPAVALSMDLENPGKFIVAWNAVYNPRTTAECVHAQYFDAAGAPVGQEFRLPQEDDPDLPRTLANSGQHTICYGADGQVVATWSMYNGVNSAAYFTILPDGFAETTGDTCCKADIDDNGLRNGLDIQPFVDLLLGDWQCLSIVDLCPADINNDGALDVDDIGPFVEYILEGADCDAKSSSSEDCNTNGVGDLIDIGAGTSQDCNQNFIPDECDIATETSADANSNGIPDECEADCNKNGVPDDWDISQETSADVDEDGVPDECQPDCNKNDIPDYWDIDPNDPDGDEYVSEDCDENGVPDECQLDCNDNLIPDVCDIDPNDPDGDTVVWPDCNENGWPDVCDFNFPPPLGSTDCNDNNIPDECDIADCDPEDPDCQDCNGNGYPDSCDIAAEISLDEDENGIPDECEEQGMMGGMMMMGEGLFGGGLLFGDPEAYFDAWVEYYEWLDEQDWGPDSELSGAEQFQLMVDKLIELGLPVRNLLAQ